MTAGELHAMETQTVRRRDGRTSFVAVCTCGWRSRDLTTAGMASSVIARHLDDPSWAG